MRKKVKILIKTNKYRDISAASTYHFDGFRDFYLPLFRRTAASTSHICGFYLPHFR